MTSSILSKRTSDLFILSCSHACKSWLGHDGTWLSTLQPCAACNHAQVLLLLFCYVLLYHTLYLHGAEHLFTVLFVTAYLKDLYYESVNIISSVLFVSSSVANSVQIMTISHIQNSWQEFTKNACESYIATREGILLKSFWGSACYSSHSAIHFWRRATCSEKNSVHDCQVGNNAQLDRNLKPTSYGQQHNCMASALSRFPVCLQITSILKECKMHMYVTIYCVNMGRYSWYSHANIWGHWCVSNLVPR